MPIATKQIGHYDTPSLAGAARLRFDQAQMPIATKQIGHDDTPSLAGAARLRLVIVPFPSGADCLSYAHDVY